MSSPTHDARAQAKQFVEQGEMAPYSMASEILYLIMNNKKWWMLPLIALLLGYGLLVLLGSTGAAPLIYTLF